MTHLWSDSDVIRIMITHVGVESDQPLPVLRWLWADHSTAACHHHGVHPALAGGNISACDSMQDIANIPRFSIIILQAKDLPGLDDMTSCSVTAWVDGK